MRGRLKGKVAMITAAGQGIGREGAHEGLMEFLETQYVSVTW